MHAHIAPSSQLLPGDQLAAEKMPGHWLLARLGKRVLRPGGLAMTRWLLDSLRISSADDVVEFAPGLGITARLIAEHKPHRYIGVERDSAAAVAVAGFLDPARDRCVVGVAERSGLPSQSATVVVGEAMLSMQPDAQKERILQEAHRLLVPEGQYAIHELCIQPDDLPMDQRQRLAADLSATIHVGVKPMTAGEWRLLLESQGFEIVAETQSPMQLLSPRRVLRDEGLRGGLRFLFNLAADRAARRRVCAMRAAFRRHRNHLSAIAVIARKKTAH